MTNVLYTDKIDRGFVLGNKVLVAEVFAKNGFLVLSSVTGEEQTSEVNADQIYQDMGGNDTPKDVLLYEWCCGDRPFHGTFAELSSQHLFAPPPPLHERVPAILPSVEHVVLKALAKDPKE